MSQPMRFTVSCPTRIEFGAGASTALVTHLPRGARTVAVLTGANGTVAEPIMGDLRQAGIEVLQVRCGTEPSVGSISAVLAKLADSRPEALVACGGGSVIDTGKLVAFLLSHSLEMDDDFDRFDQALLSEPARILCIAIPTTAGTGAEVTANSVISVPSKGAKISMRGRALNPGVALVDPSLMSGAPAQVILRSGLDAVTQVIESYTSNAATPFSDALCLPSIGKGLSALANVVDTGDAKSWGDLAWVSLSSGIALANSGLGAAHGLAAVIGGQYHAPHGALCGRLLIPVMRRNIAHADPRSIAGQRLAECATLISDRFQPAGGGDKLSGFEAWMNAHNLPRLSSWGVTREALDALARDGMAASSSKKNAVILGHEDFIRILEDSL